MTKRHRNKDRIRLTYATIVILAITTATTMLLMNFNITSNSQNDVKVTAALADATKLQAIKLMTTDAEKAKKLFLEAKRQYEELNDRNGVVDVDAQIYYIDHKK